MFRNYFFHLALGSGVLSLVGSSIVLGASLASSAAILPVGIILTGAGMVFATGFLIAASLKSNSGEQTRILEETNEEMFKELELHHLPRNIKFDIKEQLEQNQIKVRSLQKKVVQAGDPKPSYEVLIAEKDKALAQKAEEIKKYQKKLESLEAKNEHLLEENESLKQADIKMLSGLHQRKSGLSLFTKRPEQLSLQEERVPSSSRK
jgi:hypothetical protein